MINRRFVHATTTFVVFRNSVTALATVPGTKRPPWRYSGFSATPAASSDSSGSEISASWS
jgi:hypothetical protein